MKTWYEKIYGEPAPVKQKKTSKPLYEILQDEEMKRRNDAYEQAKKDYFSYLRSIK